MYRLHLQFYHLVYLTVTKILMELEKALKILDIPPFVTKSDIKKRYKELASKYHPDKGSDINKMVQINSAYKTIMEYIDNFRYSFDKDEITKQLPNSAHSENFKP